MALMRLEDDAEPEPAEPARPSDDERACIESALAEGRLVGVERELAVALLERALGKHSWCHGCRRLFDVLLLKAKASPRTPSAGR